MCIIQMNKDKQQYKSAIMQQRQEKIKKNI